jgi:hypothetical protein
MDIERSFRFRSTEDVVNMTLQNYYEFAYNPSSNPIIKSFLPKRELLFTIEKRSFAKGKHPIINAFSIYKTDKDVIIITEKLAEMIENLILNSESNNDRASCMIDTANLFCAFHELGHLLLGHCQIQKNARLCAIEKSHENTGVDIALYQMLETDADTFAAKRIGEKMVTIISDGRYKTVLGYNSIDDFYEDTLKGIVAFFYILMYLEVLESREVFMFTPDDEIPKGFRPNEATHIHPPAIARCYCSGKTLIEHLNHFFHIPPKEDYFLKTLFSSDSIFGGIELTQKQIQRKYQYLIDGTFDKNFEALKEEWFLNTRNILAPYSRIAVV